MAFFKEKETIKTYKCHRLLAVRGTAIGGYEHTEKQ
jgi:hypothetical protein